MTLWANLLCLLWIIVLQCFIGPAQTQWILVVKWNELLFLTPICFSVFGETAKKTGKIDPYYRNYVDHELYIIIIIIIIIARFARRRIRPLHCPLNSPPPSRAAALATFQLFYPTLPLSLSTVLPQVVFGPPLILRLSGVRPNTVKQSFTSSLLSTCPNLSAFFFAPRS